MSLLVGCRARFTGLASRPELNGEEATLLGWIAEKERWAVSIVRSPSSGMLVKPGSLLRSTAPFDVLDKDALAMVLVHTPAASMPALYATDRRTRDAISSKSFLTDRLYMGFASVVVKVIARDDDEDGGDDNDLDDLGYPGEYGCTRIFSASVTVDGRDAGSISCTLVNRARCRRQGAFLSACDAESQELYDIGCVLFDVKGDSRYAPLSADSSLGPNQRLSVHSSGFLYISSFDLLKGFQPDGAHKTTIAALAIEQLLALPDVRGRWQVAAYIGDGRHALHPSRERGPLSDEERAALGRAVADDCRAFVRTNFVEIDAPRVDGGAGGWMYTTKALQRQRRLSHDAAARVVLRAGATPVRSPRPLPQGLDAELMRSVRACKPDIREPDDAAVTATVAEVDRLVAAGASLDGAFALHTAAHTLQPVILLALSKRGADVNSLDANGQTPLMVAATRVEAYFHAVHHPHVDTRCVNALLRLGADTSLACTAGLSALGHYRSAQRAADDFRSALTREPKRGADMELEVKLRPPAGPTPADSRLEGGAVALSS